MRKARLTRPTQQSTVHGMNAVAAVLPVALIIVIGHLARRTNLVPASAWAGIEVLCYRVLFPAIMLISVYRAELVWARVGPFGLALLAMTAAGAVIALLALLVPGMQARRFTSIFQSITRWNSFVGLAVGASLMGAQGTALISVAIAFLIPTINIVNVVVLVLWGSTRAGIGRLILAILTNPLILGCLGGLFLNLAQIRLPEPVIQALDMTGSAAISLSLLIVGASIQLARLWSLSPALIFAVAVRLLAMPSIFWLIAQQIGLPPQVMLAGLIVASAPTAANGYLFARQMGGDAELYADILTWQTVLAVISIPFVLTLAS